MWHDWFFSRRELLDIIAGSVEVMVYLYGSPRPVTISIWAALSIAQPVRGNIDMSSKLGVKESWLEPRVRLFLDLSENVIWLWRHGIEVSTP